MPAAPTLDPIAAAALAAGTDRLARAEHAWHAATEAARVAQEGESRITQRIAALDARRAAIGQRRAAGEMAAGDAGELELIALDRESLNALLGDATAKSSAAREAADHHGRVAAMARDAVARVEAAARRDYFARHAGALAEALRKTIVAMNDASKSVGDRLPAWKPERDLRTLCLELEHGVLR